jgi:hypothetical protein
MDEKNKGSDGNGVAWRSSSSSSSLFIEVAVAGARAASGTKEEEGCKTKCDKNLTDEICGKVNGGWSLTTPAHGLVSKLAGIVTITNFINRTSKTINLPSEQPYMGYITTDGSFGWVEEGSVSVKGGDAPP